MHCELILMHRGLISMHRQLNFLCIARRFTSSQKFTYRKKIFIPYKIHASREDFIPHKILCIARRFNSSQKYTYRKKISDLAQFMYREKISSLAKFYASREDSIPRKFEHRGKIFMPCKKSCTARKRIVHLKGNIYPTSTDVKCR